MTTPLDAVRRVDPGWRFVTRVAFRFTFCYLSLRCFDLASVAVAFLHFAVTGREWAEEILDPIWRNLVPWVGEHVLQAGTIAFPHLRHSGDTKYDYGVVFCELGIALIVTVVWSVLDRKHTQYRVLHQWLRYAVSLTLALLMFGYGSIKVIPVQFGTLTLGALSLPVGGLTPQGLLWTFMAASKGYTAFTGIAEIVAGILLLLPRCTTLGALLAIGAMSNVFALNLAYDVPVKLASFHMLLFAVFLVVPETQRLASFFIFNRHVASEQRPWLSSHVWVIRAAWTARILTGGIFLATMLWSVYRGYRGIQTASTVAWPLRGIWIVDDFKVGGDPSRPLLTEKLARDMTVAPGEDRWRELILESPNRMEILLGNGTLDNVDLSLNDKADSTLVTDPGDPSWICILHLHRSSESELGVEGTVNGNPVEARFHRVKNQSSLLSSGFHWVTED